MLFFYRKSEKSKKKIKIKGSKKRKKNNELNFQMQRRRQTALTQQSTRSHTVLQKIKNLNMDDSQRQTWRTKTWLYPRSKQKRFAQMYGNSSFLISLLFSLFYLKPACHQGGSSFFSFKTPWLCHKNSFHVNPLLQTSSACTEDAPLTVTHLLTGCATFL